MPPVIKGIIDWRNGKKSEKIHDWNEELADNTGLSKHSLSHCYPQKRSLHGFTKKHLNNLTRVLEYLHKYFKTSLEVRGGAIDVGGADDIKKIGISLSALYPDAIQKWDN